MTTAPPFTPPATVTWRDAAGEHRARWLSPESPPPARLGAAGDATTAAAALARARSGEGLVYAGDYQNARQLLSAMSRRLAPERRNPPRAWRDRGQASPSTTEGLRQLFLEERRRVALEHTLLGRLLIPVGADGRVPLRRAPEVGAALAEAVGPLAGPGLVPLRDLLGMIGAHEWRRRGVEVPSLGARVHPHHGVYAPVRGEYVGLVAEAAARWPVAGRRALDVGTGTGVLAFVLARAGARVTATDLSPRAVACARENAARLGLAVEVAEADLLVGNGWDVVVANPPWLPAEAHTLLDHAVYDPGGRFLSRLVAGLPAALAPTGEAWIVISDLAERLGLRPPGTLERLAAEAGLRVDGVLEARPAHPRAQDADDPLHAARSSEVTKLHRLVRA